MNKTVAVLPNLYTAKSHQGYVFDLCVPARSVPLYQLRCVLTNKGRWHKGKPGHIHVERGTQVYCWDSGFTPFHGNTVHLGTNYNISLLHVSNSFFCRKNMSFQSSIDVVRGQTASVAWIFPLLRGYSTNIEKRALCTTSIILPIRFVF